MENEYIEIKKNKYKKMKEIIFYYINEKVIFFDFIKLKFSGTYNHVYICNYKNNIDTTLSGEDQYAIRISKKYEYEYVLDEVNIYKELYKNSKFGILEPLYIANDIKNKIIGIVMKYIPSTVRDYLHR